MKYYLLSIIKKISFGIALTLQMCYAMETNTVNSVDCSMNHQLIVDIEDLKKRILSVDDPQTLSYSEFINLKKNGLITEEQAEKLIDYAYENTNPILFRKSNEIIAPEQYSLNFLWIHKNKLELSDGCHLMGKDDALFQSKILNPLLDWQSKQPLAKINFWYDSYLIAEDNSVINNTRDKLGENGVMLDNLLFMDIRIIQEVKDNEGLYCQDVAVYFRVDLAKALTANYIMEKCENVQYVINIDSDVVAVIGEQLFDQKSIIQLNQLGICQGQTYTFNENSFIMLSKEIAKKAHYEKVIQTSIDEANSRKCYEDIFNQDVFRYYKIFRNIMRISHFKRTGAKLKFEQDLGKAMIFPQSQFSMKGNGYTDKQVEDLKKALCVNINEMV